MNNIINFKWYWDSHYSPNQKDPCFDCKEFDEEYSFVGTLEELKEKAKQYEIYEDLIEEVERDLANSGLKEEYVRIEETYEVGGCIFCPKYGTCERD